MALGMGSRASGILSQPHRGGPANWGAPAPSSGIYMDYLSGTASAADVQAAAADPVKADSLSGVLRKGNMVLAAGVGASVVGMALGYLSVKKHGRR